MAHYFHILTFLFACGSFHLFSAMEPNNFHTQKINFLSAYTTDNYTPENSLEKERNILDMREQIEEESAFILQAQTKEFYEFRKELYKLQIGNLARMNQLLQATNKIFISQFTPRTEQKTEIINGIHLFKKIPYYTLEEEFSKEQIKDVACTFPIPFMRAVRSFATFTEEGLRRDAHKINLVGPSGCGKTLMAKVAAYLAKVPYVFIKGHDLVNECKKNGVSVIDKIFEPYLSASQKIIFIFDDLTPFTNRYTQDNTEMPSIMYFRQVLDRVTDNPHIFIVATARENFKFGSLNSHFSMIRVDLPIHHTRVSLLKNKLSNFLSCPLEVVEKIGEKTKGYSFYELNDVCNLAIQYANEDKLIKKTDSIIINEEFLTKALRQNAHNHSPKASGKKWYFGEKGIRFFISLANILLGCTVHYFSLTPYQPFSYYWLTENNLSTGQPSATMLPHHIPFTAPSLMLTQNNSH